MNALCTTGAVCALAVVACAQHVTTPPGFGERTLWIENRSPHGFASLATGIFPDDVFVASDDTVRRVFDDGSWQDVHVLPAGHTLGLMVRSAFGFGIWFTDFQSNTLFRHDLPTGVTSPPQPVPPNTFDLTVTPSGSVLVNANPGFPGPMAQSGIWLVDPAGSANHRELVRLTGPSGPIAIDPTNGDLLVAILPVVVPPAPGTVRIARFDAAAIAQRIAAPTPPLVEADATSSLTTDGAFDLAFDGAGRLYVSDHQHRIVRRTDVGATAWDAQPFLSSSSADLTSLEYVAVGRGTFEPYQPSTGGRLHVGVSPSPPRFRITAVEPARPSLASSVASPIPAGAFDLLLEGFPPHPNAWLCLSPRTPTPELAVLPFDGHPLWLGLDLTAPVVSMPLALAPDGSALLGLQHAGAGITVTLQAIGMDTTPISPVLASSNPLELRLP